MKWSRLGLRQKIVATHLLVAATATVTLTVSVLLLAPWIFPPSPPSRDQLPSALLVVAVVVVVALAGVAVAVAASRRLFTAVALPVRRAAQLG